MAERYNNLDIIKNDDGKQMLESFPEIAIEDIQSDSDSFHQVVNGDRFDLIAFKYYNNPSLWWVIAIANGLSLPTEIENGMILRIPKSPKNVETFVKRKVGL